MGTRGRGGSYQNDLVRERHTETPFPEDNFGYTGSLEFRGKTAPRERHRLTRLTPAPLLTQSHELTSDSLMDPVRLEAGHQLTSRAKELQGEEEDDHSSASVSLRSDGSWSLPSRGCLGTT